MRTPIDRSRRGSALVVAVGILAVMSIMGFAFVSTMRIEYEAGKWFESRCTLDLLGTWAVELACNDLKFHPWQGAAWSPVDSRQEAWYTGKTEEDGSFTRWTTVIGEFPGAATCASNTGPKIAPA